MEIMDSQKIKFHIQQHVALQTTTLFFLALISIFLAVPILSDGQNNKLKKNKKDSGEGIVLISGRQATHEELRKVKPTDIKKINIFNDPGLTKQFKINDCISIIEISLFDSTKSPSKNPGTLQIRVNNQIVTENGLKPSPLLVFDGNICRDQNPNNICTYEMEWMDVVVGDSAIAKYGEKANNGIIKVKFKPFEVFGEYESMPEFPGGVNALRTFVKNTVKYPEKVLKDSLRGKVYVNFVITKTGKVEKVRIARGIHPILDAEAIRVVSLMPDWKPGEEYFRGKCGSLKVDVSYTIPVEFKLPLQK